MTDYERLSRGGYPASLGWKDRDTSRKAAEGVSGHAKGLRARVYDAVRAKPSTPEEVAMALDEPLHNVRPRLSECATKGLIIDSGQRRPAQGGRMAIVWRMP